MATGDTENDSGLVELFLAPVLEDRAHDIGSVLACSAAIPIEYIDLFGWAVEAYFRHGQE